MDPFTAFAISSGVLGAAGSIAEGNAGYAQGMYDSGVARENARRSRETAGQIRLAGQAAEEAKRREIRRSLGRSAAAISQAGIGGPGYGSAGAALKQAATEGEFDALNLRYGYETDAYGQEVNALSYDAEAKAARQRARMARKAGFMNAAGNLLSAGASYYGGASARRAMRPAGVKTRGASTGSNWAAKKGRVVPLPGGRP